MGLRRQYEKADDIPPFAQTVGAAKADGITIQVTCYTCDAFRPVDLDRLIAAKGPDFSLVNKRYRCTLTSGCTGYVRFSHSGRGVMRMMESADFVDWWEARERETRMVMLRAMQEHAKEKERRRLAARR